MPELKQRQSFGLSYPFNWQAQSRLSWRGVGFCSLLVGLVFMTGCGPALGSMVGPRDCSAGDDADVLVIGDSILAFHSNDCASIPDVLAGASGLKVKNSAQSGAKIAPGRGYIWGNIQKQYQKGVWWLVIIEGGINDLNGDCNCGECTEVLDNLVSEDGSQGYMPNLVDRALDDGAQVLLLGYYDVAESASLGFGACGGWIDVLNQRYERIADSREAVIFVNPSEVMSPETHPEAYLSDGIHPSVEGSRRVGGALARALGFPL